MDRFYHGFCNKTLWPLFHYFTSLTRYEDEHWREYQQVNRIYAEAMVSVLRPDDLVWMHELQLMLLPKMIREHFQEIAPGFFLRQLHFPLTRCVPIVAPRLAAGNCWRDSWAPAWIGFHTHPYVRFSLATVLRTAGYTPTRRLSLGG